MAAENDGTTQDGTTTGGSTTPGTSPHQTGQTGATSGASAAGGGAAAAAATGTTEGGSATTSGATGSGQTAEDRSKWHPPHVNKRLSKENGTLKQQLDQMRNQMAALTGIAPPAPAGPARRLPQGVTEDMVESARQEFALIYGEKASRLLSDEKLLDTFFEFVEKDLPEFRDSRTSQWKTLGTSHGRALNAEIKAQIGDMSDVGKAKIFASFKHELETNEEFFDRYQLSDPDLSREFVASYKQEVLDPYHTRQTSTATAAASSTVVRGRALPKGGSSSTVVPAGQSAQEPKDEDARHRGAFQRFKQRRDAASAAA